MSGFSVRGTIELNASNAISSIDLLSSNLSKVSQQSSVSSASLSSLESSINRLTSALNAINPAKVNELGAVAQKTSASFKQLDSSVKLLNAAPVTPLNTKTKELGVTAQKTSTQFKQLETSLSGLNTSSFGKIDAEANKMSKSFQSASTNVKNAISQINPTILSMGTAGTEAYGKLMSESSAWRSKAIADAKAVSSSMKGATGVGSVGAANGFNKAQASAQSFMNEQQVNSATEAENRLAKSMQNYSAAAHTAGTRSAENALQMQRSGVSARDLGSSVTTATTSQIKQVGAVKSLNGAFSQGQYMVDRAALGLDNYSTKGNSVATSTNKIKSSMSNATKGVNELDTAFGMLRRTVSLVVVMFGFQLAMDILNIGKSAMDAEYKIKSLASSMQWSGSATQGYLDRMNELKDIYPKINMNSTAQSAMEIARMYDLTSDEATKFIKTSAVFNSAMASEGRSTEDASLALKDYLDQGAGWTKRMQEIGVTRENLLATGKWNGDKSDISGMFDALDQVLKDKHYDEMATKLYTLEDAYNALMNKIGDFAGSGLKGITPLVIQLTYGIMGLIDDLEGLGNWFNSLPDFVKVPITVGAITTAVTLLSYAIVVRLIPAISSAALKFATFAVANPELFAIIAAITILVTLVYELGKAFGWWTDFNSMIERISAFLGTLEGQFAAVITLVGGAGVLAILKFGGAFDKLKTSVGNAVTKLLEYINVSKKAEQNTGGGGTGGKTPKTPTSTQTPTPTNFKFEAVESLKKIGLQAVKAAAVIAVVMALAAEAIALLAMPMLALAGVGILYKAIQPQVQAGVEGIKAVSVVMAIVLPPIIALMLIIDKSKASFQNIKSVLVTGAEVIIVGLTLVSVAIGMLIAPLLALALLGFVSSLLGNSVAQGISAINAISTALYALVPVIPLFVVAIAIGAVTIGTGGAALAVGAAAIVIGLAAVAFAIVCLAIPLASIAALGAIASSLGNIDAGIKAIEQTSKALDSLSQVMASLAKITWDSLSNNIAKFLSGYDSTEDQLNALVGEDSVLKKMPKFIEDFNNITANMPAVNSNAISTLNNVANAISAIDNITKSISNVVTNSQSTENGANPSVTDTSEGLSTKTVFQQKIDTVKATLNDIAGFINDFNAIQIPDTSGIADKVAKIQQAGSAINAIKGVTDSINSTLSGINGAQKKASDNTGAGGQLGGALFGSGDALSLAMTQIKSSLTQINSFITQLAGMQIADTSSIAEKVTKIQQAGNAIKTMSGVVNSVKSAVSAIGGAGAAANKNNNVGQVTGTTNSIGNGLDQIYNAIKDVLDFANKLSGLTGGENVPDLSGVGNAIQTISTYLTNIANTIAAQVGNIGGKAWDIGNAIQSKLKEGIGDLGSIVNPQIDGMVSAFDRGRTASDNLGGALSNFGGTVDTVVTKVNNLKTAIDDLPTSKDISINVKQNGKVNTNGSAGVFVSSGTESYTASTGSGGFNLFGLFAGVGGSRMSSSAGVGGGVSFNDVVTGLLSRSKYSFYYGSKGNNAITDGEANCVDGSLSVMGLASMMGKNAEMGFTNVDGINHAYAIVDNEIIDSTAIQTIGKLKFPHVNYNSAGVNTGSSSSSSTKTTNITVNVDSVTGANKEEITKDFERKIEEVVYKVQGVNKTTGI